MICGACNKVLTDGYAFCPHCGEAVKQPGQVTSSDSKVGDQSSHSTVSESQNKTGKAEIGTIVFGAFAVLSLIASIVKGIVPIYLLEAAGWAVAAWYWQRKRPRSEEAKAAVLALGILVAVGEVVHIVYQSESEKEVMPAVNGAIAVNRDSFAPGTPPTSFPTPLSVTKPISPHVASTPMVNSETKKRKENTANTKPIGKQKPLSPTWSCNTVLGVGQSRIPLKLGPSEIALINASMENVKDQRSFLFKIHNGTSFCITSVEVTFQYKDADSSENRVHEETFHFLPGDELAPNQDSDRAACEFRPEGEFLGGSLDNMCHSGLLEHWELVSAQGYLATRQTDSND